MKLIKTDDGLIGLDFDKNCDVIWCDSVEQAIPIMKGNYNHLGDQGPTVEELEQDVRYALDHMAKNNHSIAEFGVFGSFMYTAEEEDPMGDGSEPKRWP